MGSGAWTATSFANYSTKCSKTYDCSTGRVSGQQFTSHSLDKSLDPKNVIRECVNSEEHPNVIPVILALDVTGSMGKACDECASALNVIMTSLYEKFKDIEFCVMGIGDFAYDTCPLQVSQFESDIRIAEAMDKVYMEKGGGGNSYESYTAAWLFGLHRTKIDAIEKQGRKGIIITMGDECVNPYLPSERVNSVLGTSYQSNIETNELVSKVKEKFDLYHIAIDDRNSSWEWHKKSATPAWKQLLGQNFMVSTIENLAQTITDCVSKSVGVQETSSTPIVDNLKRTESGDITW